MPDSRSGILALTLFVGEAITTPRAEIAAAQPLRLGRQHSVQRLQQIAPAHLVLIEQDDFAVRPD
jgi:hypothetical protein